MEDVVSNLLPKRCVNRVAFNFFHGCRLEADRQRERERLEKEDGKDGEDEDDENEEERKCAIQDCWYTRFFPVVSGSTPFPSLSLSLGLSLWA